LVICCDEEILVSRESHAPREYREIIGDIYSRNRNIYICTTFYDTTEYSIYTLVLARPYTRFIFFTESQTREIALRICIYEYCFVSMLSTFYSGIVGYSSLTYSSLII
jgi:hypothetical protein